MNAVKTLIDFIDNATKERKYADNTARGLRAALKLYEGYLNDAEKESLDTLESNLGTIANDIYSKQKNGSFSSKTLMVYKTRILKVISDYRLYGSSPGKMAAWNPRRSSPVLKTSVDITKNKRGKVEIPEGEIVDSDQPNLAKLIDAVATTRGGVTSFDNSGRYADINRSEVFLREGFKITIELPIDLTSKEANRLKQYIDLMVME